MSELLPAKARDLFGRKTFTTVATLLPDGRPHLSIVWTKVDGDDVLFYTAEGRQKARDIRRDPRVTLVTYPWEDPYRYVELRGTATLHKEGGAELIDELTKKYVGIDQFAWGAPGSVPLVVRVRPEKVNWMQRDAD